MVHGQICNLVANMTSRIYKVGRLHLRLSLIASRQIVGVSFSLGILHAASQLLLLRTFDLSLVSFLSVFFERRRELYNINKVKYGQQLIWDFTSESVTGAPGPVGQLPVS